jgi:hypothetical protein
MRSGGVGLEEGATGVKNSIGERSVGKERKRIGDFGRGRGDWVVARWGEVEAWTKGLNAKLPTGGLDVHSFMDFYRGQTSTLLWTEGVLVVVTL